MMDEEDIPEDRKEWRKDRKQKTRSDRSKYKETDRQKNETPLILKKGERGLVVQITSGGIVVEHQGNLYVSSLKGALKQEVREHKNLVIVGDEVAFTPLNEGEGVIFGVFPRRSELVRQDNLTRRKKQLIAANVDAVAIVVSVASPPLRPSLIDRYIIAAVKGGLNPIIVLNKMDLLKDADASSKAVIQEFIEAYQKASIPVFPVSYLTGEGVENLEAFLNGKLTVFSGQSGVGKTSLVNQLTGLSMKVGDIVNRTQKGSHTTSLATLIPLLKGGFCIDTPGIKSFGIWDLKKNEIESFFEEIHAMGRSCFFPNCSHTHEVDCAVKEAMEKGELSSMRYHSYLSLLDEVDSSYLRR